jgi:hypothetical protein
MDLGTELDETLDTLFKKHVPAPVREFLELKDAPAPPKTLKPAKTAGNNHSEHPKRPDEAGAQDENIC